MYEHKVVECYWSKTNKKYTVLNKFIIKHYKWNQYIILLSAKEEKLEFQFKTWSMAVRKCVIALVSLLHEHPYILCYVAIYMSTFLLLKMFLAVFTCLIFCLRYFMSYTTTHIIRPK